jgi:hypothetical protein
MLKLGGRKLGGGGMQGDEPNWEPLLELAPEEIDDFMWMFEVELEDGAMVQAYKHWWTRGYVHLDFGGRAFVFTEDNLYAEVDGEALLAAVLRGRESRREIVRDNDWVADGKITWARSATRHCISHEDTAYVIEHAGICFEEDDGLTYSSRSSSSSARTRTVASWRSRRLSCLPIAFGLSTRCLCATDSESTTWRPWDGEGE